MSLRTLKKPCIAQRILPLQNLFRDRGFRPETFEVFATKSLRQVTTCAVFFSVFLMIWKTVNPGRENWRRWRISMHLGQIESVFWGQISWLKQLHFEPRNNFLQLDISMDRISKALCTLSFWLPLNLKRPQVASNNFCFEGHSFALGNDIAACRMEGGSRGRFQGIYWI